MIPRNTTQISTNTDQQRRFVPCLRLSSETEQFKLKDINLFKFAENSQFGHDFSENIQSFGVFPDTFDMSDDNQFSHGFV